MPAAFALLCLEQFKPLCGFDHCGMHGSGNPACIDMQACATPCIACTWIVAHFVGGGRFAGFLGFWGAQMRCRHCSAQAACQQDQPDLSRAFKSIFCRTLWNIKSSDTQEFPRLFCLAFFTARCLSSGLTASKGERVTQRTDSVTGPAQPVLEAF